MTGPMYDVHEVFTSLQGEGTFAGTPAVFVRFSGCDQDCSFCDTPQHEDAHLVLDNDALVERIDYEAHLNDRQVRHLVLTSGEPMLQVDAELLDALDRWDKLALVQIETNGHVAPKDDRLLVELNEDFRRWITWSPKVLEAPKLPINEIKVLWPTPWGGDPTDVLGPWAADVGDLSIQPMLCSGAAICSKEMLRELQDWLERNPGWSLSVQLQKLLGWK